MQRVSFPSDISFKFKTVSFNTVRDGFAAWVTVKPEMLKSSTLAS